MLFKNKNDFSLHPNVQSPTVPTQHPRKAGEQASTAPAKEGSTISTSTTIRVPRVLHSEKKLPPMGVNKPFGVEKHYFWGYLKSYEDYSTQDIRASVHLSDHCTHSSVSKHSCVNMIRF